MLFSFSTARRPRQASARATAAFFIMGYSVGQWIGPWATGRLFDYLHSYLPVWKLMSAAALLGSVAIYALSVDRRVRRTDE